MIHTKKQKNKSNNRKNKNKKMFIFPKHLLQKNINLMKFQTQMKYCKNYFLNNLK